MSCDKDKCGSCEQKLSPLALQIATIIDQVMKQDIQVVQALFNAKTIQVQLFTDNQGLFEIQLNKE
jgi:hypothetical protein